MKNDSIYNINSSQLCELSLSKSETKDAEFSTQFGVGVAKGQRLRLAHLSIPYGASIHGVFAA